MENQENNWKGFQIMVCPFTRRLYAHFTMGVDVLDDKKSMGID